MWDTIKRWLGFKTEAVKESWQSNLLLPDFFPTSLQAWRLFKRLLTTFPTLQRRRVGQGQIEPFSRERTVNVARDVVAFNPYAQGLIEALTTQVIGKGIRYSVEGDNVPVREETQEWLNDWLDREDWPQREAEVYQRTKRDGEAFLWFRGGTYRAIEPEFIRAATGEIEWNEGVYCELDDIETPEAYGYNDGYHHEIIDASEVVHIKSNVDRCIKRGISDFAPTAEAVEDAWTTARNMIKSAARREGIVYFVQQATAEQQDVQELIQNQLEDFTRPTPFGTTQSPGQESVSFKQGVGVEYIDKGQELAAVPSPEGAEASLQAINTALLAVARKYGFPTWMISGDSSNNGFASALVAESPQARTIEREQTAFCRHMRTCVWKALEDAVDAGELPPEALKLDLVVTAHSAVPRDRKGETDRHEKLHNNRIISRRKWTEEEGYDYETQQAQLQQEEPAPVLGERTAPPLLPGAKQPGSPPARPPQAAGLPLDGSGANRFNGL